MLNGYRLFAKVQSDELMQAIRRLVKLEKQFNIHTQSSYPENITEVFDRMLYLLRTKNSEQAQHFEKRLKVAMDEIRGVSNPAHNKRSKQDANFENNTYSNRLSLLRADAAFQILNDLGNVLESIFVASQQVLLDHDPLECLSPLTSSTSTTSLESLESTTTFDPDEGRYIDTRLLWLTPNQAEKTKEDSVQEELKTSFAK